MFTTRKLSLVAALVIVFSSTSIFAVDCYEAIHPDYLKVDVSSLIHVKTEDDAARIRQNVIDYLWKADGFPRDKMPAKVTADFPKWMADIGSDNIARVERLDIEMDYGLHSIAYLFHPKTNANRLLIFQMGHSDNVFLYGGKETIKFFLNKGFSVIVFWMPLCGENDTPVNVPGKGSVRFDSKWPTKRHDQMSETLDNKKGSFIRFFLEPVVVAINYVEKNYNYHDINMVGISGGGWTTNLCAAIEPRISYSFSVAGSIPLYLREGPCHNDSRGDAEQWWPELYEKVASYLDLYILGGYGKGRKLVQVYNKYDSCCFYGINYRTFAPFVAKAVEKLGKGSFSAYLDDTHREHKISQKVIDEVIWPAIASRKHGKANSVLKSAK